MASTTCSIKPVKRSAGRSATAAAAYRAGAEIVDQRTGEVHDYTRKGGVVSAEIVAPDHAPAWAHDREALWNAAELAENRKNSQVAREFLVGLPHELDAVQRQQLAREFAQSLVDRYGFAVDVCIHAPDKDGDQRNHHAHILATTRRMEPDGLGKKTRELDDKTTGPLEVRWVRQQFEDLTNDHLERAGIDERIDMRSYQDQGLDYEPTVHMGPAVAAMERREPGSTAVGRDNQERMERNLVRELETAELLDLEAEADYLEGVSVGLAGDVAALEYQIEQARREAALQLAQEDYEQLHEVSWSEPEAEPEPSPAAAEPPRQPEKPKKPPTDEKLAASIGRVLDERPIEPPTGAVFDRQTIEDWVSERWAEVRERAQKLSEAVRERLKPLFDREATRHVENAGYEPSAIQRAGLEPSEPEQPRTLADVRREQGIGQQQEPQPPQDHQDQERTLNEIREEQERLRMLDDLEDDEPQGPSPG